MKKSIVFNPEVEVRCQICGGVLPSGDAVHVIPVSLRVHGVCFCEDCYIDLLEMSSKDFWHEWYLYSLTWWEWFVFPFVRLWHFLIDKLGSRKMVALSRLKRLRKVISAYPSIEIKNELE